MQVSINIQDDLYQQLVNRGIDIQNEAINTFKSIIATKTDSKDFLENQTYFQNALDSVESDNTKLISHDDVWSEIDKKTEL